MKNETRNITVVVSLTIVILLMAIIFFFTLGSDIALLFAMVGVPAIFIALVIALILGGRMPAEEIKIKKMDLENTTHTFLEFKTKVSEVGKEFNVDTDRAEFELKNVEETLNRQGCMFRGDEVKYDEGKLKKTKLAEISKIGKEIKGITEKIADALYDAIRAKINWYAKELGKLSDSGYEVENAILSLNSISGSGIRKDLSALEKLASDATDEVKGALEGCLSKVRDNVAFARGFFDVSQANRDLELAEENLRDEDYGNCVFLLDKLMSELNEKLSGNFREYKSGLIRCFSDVLSVMDEKENEEVRKLKEVVVDVNTPSEMKLLIGAFNDLVRELNELLERMHSEIFELLDDIGAKRAPDWFSMEQSVPELEELPQDIEKLPKVFEKLYKELRTPLTNLRDKTRVLKAYPRVESMINRNLKERGEVGADELKVKRAELFMKLYSEKHPEVIYDDARQRLRAESFEPLKPEERFVVRVKIRDVKSGAPLNAKVLVGKKEHEALGGELNLELPQGRHTLRVLAEGYASKDVRVNVEGDTETEVEVELEEVGLPEQLCGDMEERIKGQMPKLIPQVESIFKERGYVASEDKISIKKGEYVPCFLFLWAEENENAKFVKSDGECMVYDVSRAKDKLVNALNGLQIEMFKGESYRFDEITSFMDLPLPVEELKFLLQEVKDDSRLQYYIEINENIVKLVGRK